MNAEQVFDILRESMLVTLIICGPPMAIGLVVGVAISLFQAMTQIQEMTLTFVPKLVVLFITMIIFMPFMLATMIKFTEFIFDQIIAGGRT
ncbi:MAG: flagellar biosynthesis protein FliQ [Alphaproteobacteria bacterium]|nr:flagellar biosynthesis protein FliQ [Alphaproteobacteria bacterium]